MAVSKEKFLSNVSHRLGSNRWREIPIMQNQGVPNFYKENQFTTGELEEQFIEGWRKLGGEAAIFHNPSEVAQKIQQIIQDFQVKKVGCWINRELEILGIPEIIQSSGAKMILDGHGADRNDVLANIEECELGITWADYAIGNTSSVVLLSSHEQPRSISLLPPIYIAVFKSSQLVWRLGEVFGDLKEKGIDPSSYTSINLITGPSRTSDIENDLAIGVHGPGKVYAFIIQN